jgi:hypothetical protein
MVAASVACLRRRRGWHGLAGACERRLLAQTPSLARVGGCMRTAPARADAVAGTGVMVHANGACSRRRRRWHVGTGYQACTVIAGRGKPARVGPYMARSPRGYSSFVLGLQGERIASEPRRPAGRDSGLLRSDHDREGSTLNLYVRLPSRSMSGPFVPAPSLTHRTRLGVRETGCDRRDDGNGTIDRHRRRTCRGTWASWSPNPHEPRRIDPHRARRG